MRIAQIITTLDVGGAEKQLLLLCRGLQRQGHDVFVGCIKKPGPLLKAFAAEQIPVRCFDQSFAADVRTLAAVKKWLKEIRPDIVHTHLFKADFYGGIAASSLKIPLVSSKRNIDRYLENWLYARFAHRLAVRCNAIVAISNAVRSHFAKYAGIEEGKIQVIPIGIEMPREIDRSNSAFVRFGVVGRLADQKGHESLIRAFAASKDRLPDARLLVFGTGPLEDRLKSLVSNAGLGGRIEFCGLVLDPEKIFGQIDVLVLPSAWEGAGNVLLEAMAYGLPVIATNTGGIPEYVNSECAVLVPPESADSLSYAIVKLSGDRQAREILGRRGKERSKVFDFSRTLDAHLKLYHRVTESQ